MPRLPIHRELPDAVVYPDSPYQGFDHLNAQRNRRRIRIFLSVVIISLSVSLSYTFLRPAVYESRATLLVTPPVIDERANAVTNAQHVELELQFLTGHGLLSRLLEKLSGTVLPGDSAHLTLYELQEMLAAKPVQDTNLVDLIARGPDKQLLPVMLDAWVDTYQDAHGDAIKAESETDTTELEQLLLDFKQKVEEKRLQLDSFRKEYDIVSMERNENRILRKLTGLTDSLNKASEEEVAARSRLDAIRAAIKQGRPVSSTQGQDSLTNLEQRLVEIQEQLKELEQEFTPRYMSVDPKINGLVRKRELLEQEIRKKRREGQQSALAEAEQDLASAQQTVASLQRQLDEHKQRTMDFTTRFAEHEALQGELLQLETAYREAQDQQLQMQVNSASQYPRITIKERAFVPERPVYPLYMRDAGISVAASLLAGLLLLLIYDFLTRPARQPVAHDIKQVFMASPDTRVLGRIDDQPLPQPAAVPALEHQLPRELSQAEVLELLRNSTADARLLIACLLSGLTAGEARELQWSDIDRAAGVIHVSGKNSRNIPVTAPLQAAIDAFMPAVEEVAGPLWQDPGGNSLGPDEMAAMLLYSAHDAGLTRPADITPEAIRHTYVAFLVRKGVRMNDLVRLVGYISPASLAGYGVYSPPGSAVSLDSVESLYPALQRFYQHSSAGDNASPPV